MTALVIAIVIAAIVAAIMAAIATGLLVVIVVPVAIFVIGWLLLMGASRMRTGDVVRREAAREGAGEFLGPGGPDDPRS